MIPAARSVPLPTENPHLSLAMNEASSLTEHVTQILSAKPLVEARAELARGLGALRFDSLRVHCQSLERDPAENSTWYLAADVLDSGKTSPVLFQWSPGAAETTLGRFQNQLLSHRIHTGAGEIELRVFPKG